MIPAATEGWDNRNS